MAQEFYLVKIGDIYLTDDGLLTGRACLNKVAGLSGLFLDHSGATAVPISGLPFNFVKENEGKGVRIITQPFAMKSSVLDDVKDLIDDANDGGSAIAVQISDGPGAQNVDCDPLFEGGLIPLEFAENFFNDDSFDVQIRLITRGFTA